MSHGVGAELNIVLQKRKLLAEEPARNSQEVERAYGGVGEVDGMSYMSRQGYC